MKVVSIPNIIPQIIGEDLFVKLPEKFLREKLVRAGLPRSTYFHYLSTRMVPLAHIVAASSAEEIWEKAEGYCSRSKPALVKFPHEVDMELAYLIGAMRDGSISRRNNVEYTLCLFQKGKWSYVWLRKMSSILRRKFGVAPKIETDRGGHRILVHSKPVLLFMQHAFQMPMDQRYWDTPDVIKNAATEIGSIANGYVAGFFDAEGYVTSIETHRKTGRSCIVISQNNRQSLEFIGGVLKNIGIKSSIYRRKDLHNLNIFGKNAILQFYFYFPVLRKKKRLMALLDRF